MVLEKLKKQNVLAHLLDYFRTKSSFKKAMFRFSNGLVIKDLWPPPPIKYRKLRKLRKLIEKIEINEKIDKTEKTRKTEISRFSSTYFLSFLHFLTRTTYFLSFLNFLHIVRGGDHGWSGHKIMKKKKLGSVFYVSAP